MLGIWAYRALTDGARAYSAEYGNEFYAYDSTELVNVSDTLADKGLMTVGDCSKKASKQCCRAAAVRGYVDQDSFNHCIYCNHPDCSELQPTGPITGDPTQNPFEAIGRPPQETHTISPQEILADPRKISAFARAYATDDVIMINGKPVPKKYIKNHDVAEVAKRTGLSLAVAAIAISAAIHGRIYDRGDVTPAQAYDRYAGKYYALNETDYGREFLPPEKVKPKSKAAKPTGVGVAPASNRPPESEDAPIWEYLQNRIGEILSGKPFPTPVVPMPAPTMAPPIEVAPLVVGYARAYFTRGKMAYAVIGYGREFLS